MSINFYISMTSGIQGPASELTNEQAEKAAELAQQLTEEWVGDKPGGLSHLHATNYIVAWYEEVSPVKSVHVDAYGYAMVWMEGDQDWRHYKDTVGLWAYLAPFGYAALRNWLDAHEKAMKEYHEEMLRTTKQEEI